MTLPARAAPLRGDDYQHAIGWLWACRMLEGAAEIASVSVEDAGSKAFDDVVVRRIRGADIYIQAKSSNYGNKIVDTDWLLTPDAPTGRSPLQHFHDTYVKLTAEDGDFSLELWTNRGFDHTNPLLGGLRDQKHDKIDTSQMLAKGPRSAVGKERRLWAAHLDVSANDLAVFLDVVRWKHTASELDIRKQAKPLMKLAGLRSDDRAVILGVYMIRGWVTDGLGPQSAADVGRQAAAMGLVPESRGVPIATEFDEMLAGLPPGCRARIKSLRDESPEVADRVAHLLTQRATRTAGVLVHLVDNPPDWLVNADSLAWEAFAAFSDAHQLDGADSQRQRAIDLGSPRGFLYRAYAAVDAAECGNVEHAEELLAKIPDDCPLHSATRARISDNAVSVIETVRALALSESPDPDLAIFGIVSLAWAYVELEEFESALAVLKEASQQFPDRASFHLHRANLTVALACRRMDDGIERPDLLRSAVAAALEARNRSREWGGPSPAAVSTAAKAMLLLNEPERVLDLALPGPEGEATDAEAAAPSVIGCIANALLVLGRHEALDELDLDRVDGSEGAQLRALRARSRGDANAVALMREAAEQATDDRTRLMSLHGLAMFGEVNEAVLAEVSTATDADRALVRGLAASNRQEYPDAARHLWPYRRTSPMHAELLALVQHHSGATDDAIETLKGVAENRSAPSLYGPAVMLLIEQDRLDEAESLVLRALGCALSRSVECGLRHSLIDIAQRRQDWTTMGHYAQALLDRFPEAPLATWAVIQALAGRAEYQAAWRFIVEHQVEPIDESTALLAIQVYVGAGAPEGDAERLLDIASGFADSEMVAGTALAALMTSRGADRLTVDQRSQFREMLDQYFERFPGSQVLQAYKFESPEELQEVIESRVKPHSVEQAELVTRVRNGQMPYGTLRLLSPLPYAELLVKLVAGALTAISTNEESLSKERSIARAARGHAVSVDTSVVAFGIHCGIVVDALASVFSDVLVADELIADARVAALSTAAPIEAYASYSPELGGVDVIRVTETQRQQTHAAAARVRDVLVGWQSTRSGGLPRPDGIDPEVLRPWDSALRVASDRGCALWCDDLALRVMAESEGIRTFGSYALYQVLAAEADMECLPALSDLKQRLLRAAIADVPLRWQELSTIADSDDGSDLAVIRFLERPLSWSNVPATLRWYFDRFALAAAASDQLRAIRLMRAASCGLGMSTQPELRREIVGGLLAAALGTIRDPAMTPIILVASRYACREVDPSGALDVLREAVAVLLGTLENESSPADAARTVAQIMSQAEQADRNTAAAAILGARD